MFDQDVGVSEKMWFSDEAHFYIHPAINKQNCRFWGSEKPTIYHEKPLHGDYITVWAALSESGIIGPVFFEDRDGTRESVNADRYLRLLKTKFLPSLKRKGIDLGQAWYQQYGAAHHTAGKVIEWLDENFPGRYLSYRTERIWPPHSPDLNPLDFFLWGYLKDRVYTPLPETVEDVKQAIRKEIKNIKQETCRAVFRNVCERL
jgi:hypothetical protein